MHAPFHRLAAALVLTALLPTILLAGMPSPYTVLSEMAQMRLQAISFFLAGLLLCAGGVRWLWNYLRKDFPRLPQLSFPKALSLVFLWGLLSFVVLTMISGARELMTPGAWKPKGLTYQFDKSDQPAPSNPSAAQMTLDQNRQRQLEQLWFALSLHARDHDGHFPTSLAESTIPERLRMVPEGRGASYLCGNGRTTRDSDAILVFEPRIFGDDQFVLLVKGDVVRMRPDEIRQALETKVTP